MNHLLLEYIAKVERFILVIREIDDIFLFLFFDAPLHKSSRDIGECCNLIFVFIFEGGDETL